MSSLIRSLFIIFLSTALATIASAQPSHKRVGIVLSGGSAFGFAHVGVLKWLEKNQVPVDYIAGTSMGALIGGLYATGMSEREMEQQLASIDWDNLFRATIPHRLRTFRRKEDDRAFQNNLEFGRGFASTTGLDSVHPVGLLLSRLTFPYPDDISFDDLPIPFRCTAVELNSAKIVRFSEGSLGQAMRASMSIPLVFTTVDESGRSYVDGGVFENLPVSTLLPGPDRPKSWQPDVVVTVRLTQETEAANGQKRNKATAKVTTGNVNSAIPANVFDVIGRLIVAVTSENVVRSMAQVQETPDITSIPLVARLKDIAVDDFSRWREAMDAGEAEAERHRAEFAPFQLNDTDWAAYQQAKAARRKRSIRPTRVVVLPQDSSRKLDPRLASFIKSRVSRFAGRTFSLGATALRDSNTALLHRELDSLTGTGIFESISYNQVLLNGGPALAIRPKEKTYGPPFFQANLSIDAGDTDNIQTTFHVRMNYLGRGLDAADEYRTDIILGSRRELAWEWYRPLPFKNTFLMPSAYTRKQERNLYTGGITGINFATEETAVGLDAGVDLGRTSQVRLGQRLGRRQYSSRGIPGLPDGKDVISATVLRYVYDNQDDVVVPRSGLYARIDGSWYQKAPVSEKGYRQLSGEARQSVTINDSDSLQATVVAGAQIDGPTPLAEQFTLGGPFRLAANFEGELRGEHARFFSIGLVRRMTPRLALLGGAFHLGGWFEQGAVETGGQWTRRRDIHLAAFAPTHFGPVTLGAAIGDAGKKRLYIRFGRLL